MNEMEKEKKKSVDFYFTREDAVKQKCSNKVVDFYADNMSFKSKESKVISTTLVINNNNNFQSYIGKQFISSNKRKSILLFLGFINISYILSVWIFFAN